MFITGIKPGNSLHRETCVVLPTSEWIYIAAMLYIRIWDVLSSNPDRGTSDPLLRSFRKKPDSTFIRLRFLPFKSFLVILLSDATWSTH